MPVKWLGSGKDVPSVANGEVVTTTNLPSHMRAASLEEEADVPDIWESCGSGGGHAELDCGRLYEYSTYLSTRVTNASANRSFPPRYSQT